MSGSVGVGGLIIGISMLVIFSMAYQAISLQIESGVDRIEDADEPLPACTHLGLRLGFVVWLRLGLP